MILDVVLPLIRFVVIVILGLCLLLLEGFFCSGGHTDISNGEYLYQTEVIK